MQKFYYLCSVFMDKKTIFYIIEWAVALAACVFLGYKLVTFEDYPALWESLRGMAWQHYLALGVCVALMPVNMAIEAWRWRTLWNVQGDDVPCTKEISFNEAQRQVYYSKLAGLITPWRLGEYPARGVLMEVQRDNVQSTKELMTKVLAMGAVGSATMTAAIVLAGMVALVFSPTVLAQLGDSYLYALAVLILLLMIALVIAPKVLRKYADLNRELLLRSLAQSFVRLLCWCVQLALVLYALGAVTGDGLPVTGYGLPIYYLLVTITPNVPLAEVGVRGAWAIVVFGSVNAALAGVLLWGINTLLPCLGWFFFRKK